MGAFSHTLRTEDELRELYRQPAAPVRAKKRELLDGEAQRFVELSPFCLLATADEDGRCDVSPRGGPPGFVRVLDERRLAIPDLNGNNLLDSITNIVANPNVGLLFVLPGRDETLRVEGEAVITTDEAILSRWEGELRRPKVAIGVAVRSAFVHCAKSFRRGRIWEVGTWGDFADGPGLCELMAGAPGLEVTTEELAANAERVYARDLARDLPE